ncbi:MAG: hypothetical protein IID16_00745 [Candidatus Marinimicrobia bacterium]|nr:hypothetical protein [Candidatus Neomarinimicrobiota bacterium]
MKLKKGVRTLGIRPELVLAIMVAEKIYLDKGKELVITSLSGGEHSDTSLHYAGSGVDLRTRYFTKKQKLEVFNALKKKLTRDYDVILEKTHIHIEYQPRR